MGVSGLQSPKVLLSCLNNRKDEENGDEENGDEEKKWAVMSHVVLCYCAFCKESVWLPPSHLPTALLSL